MNKKQIIILAIVLAVIIVASVVTIILINNSNNDNPCDKHVDANGDGNCDVCGESLVILPVDPEYQDKVEAQSRYNVTVAEGEGFSVNAPKAILKGETLVFTVEISNYFDGTNAVVKVNDKVVAPDDDGNYTVKRVSSDITISVTGLSRVYYGVAKTYKGLGVKVVGDDKVAVGGNYTFTLQVSQHATEQVVVKVNGQIVTPNDGVYTVANCNDNVIVEVSDPVVPKVNATIDGVGYTIEALPTVIGDTYYFSVHINQDYENHQPLVVKANGSVVEAVDGIYAIQNAPQDVTIAVEGLTLREKITLTFANCDLAPATVYKATIWQGATPTREGYLFNGWTDLFGNPIDIDYMSDVTLYASWITEEGIDYAKQITVVANKIKTRYTALGSDWWRLTPQDKALSDEHQQLLAHHTEFEKGFYSQHANVTDFIEKTQYVSDQVVGKNAFYGASENAVQLWYNVDGERTTKGASMIRILANGDDMDGVRHNIQVKNASNQLILDYNLEFGKYNFKQLCDKYGKVTFWLSTNAVGLTAVVGEEYLFEATTNTAIASGGTCALYRVDVQEGMIFVNSKYVFDLDEATYNGESDFVIKVHRLDIESHQYAYVQISNIYVGANDPSLVKVVKTSETFAVENLITLNYIDNDESKTWGYSSNEPAVFNGKNWSIERPNGALTEPHILDYDFTVKAFNYARYCKKYGSVSFKFMSNQTGATVKVGDTTLLTTTKDQVYSITIQDGSIFVDGVHLCVLTDDVYNGNAPLVLQVNRQEGKLYYQINISDFVAGPKDDSLVVPA